MAAFNDLIVRQAANDTAAEFVRDKIRGIVKDPAVAELLAPKDHPIGTKRICVDTDYYADLQPRQRHAGRPHATTPIERDHAGPACRPASANTQVDAIVFATGFDAMTGALTKIDIRGHGRRSRCTTNGRPGRAPISA